MPLREAVGQLLQAGLNQGLSHPSKRCPPPCIKNPGATGGGAGRLAEVCSSATRELVLHPSATRPHDDATHSVSSSDWNQHCRERVAIRSLAGPSCGTGGSG